MDTLIIDVYKLPKFYNLPFYPEAEPEREGISPSHQKKREKMKCFTVFSDVKVGKKVINSENF